MFRSLLVGFGRAGRGLHLRVLSKARAASGDRFHPGPVVAYDPAAHDYGIPHEVTTTESLATAAELLPPAHTVTHVCTPPGRAAILAELAQHGFRRLIVEKPLATGTDELRALSDLRTRYGLEIAVVSHWLDAELTQRLDTLVRSGRFGELRSIGFAAHKPRFTRTAIGDGHPTAFDVEIPHSLGVLLRLAGPARLLDADWTDMRSQGQVHPRMGGARMTLRHDTGVLSEICSDLTAPVRQRRIELEFTRGTVVGHYPVSDQDDHAQLVLAGERHVFRDDALTRFVLRTYDRFHGSAQRHGTFDLHCDIVRLIDAAKAYCADFTDSPPEGHIAHVG